MTAFTRQPDMRPQFPVTEKAWGHEELIVSTPLYTSKYLIVKPGFQSSLHWHPLKDETFVVLEGECIIQTSQVRHPGKPTLKAGDSIRIIPGLPHRFGSRDGCVLLEVSTKHDDDDVVRIEPSGPLP
jgi:mannose-6-phosphate isomerase